MNVALLKKDARQTWSQPESTTVATSITESVAFKPVHSEPPWIEPTLSKMSTLLGLNRNWDRRGSTAISGDALSFAFSMLCQTMAPTTPPPSIIPLGHGGIQLIWSGQNAEIEVEVERPNEIVIYYRDQVSGEEREWSAATEFSELAKLLRSTFAR
jgi:hypothetical protein